MKTNVLSKLRTQSPGICRCHWLTLICAVSVLSVFVKKSDGQQIYTDSIQGGFQNWSWGTTIDLQNSSPVHSGNSSVAVTHNSGFTGMYFGMNGSFDVQSTDEIRFQIHGGVGGQTVAVFAVHADTSFIDAGILNLQGGAWNQVIVNIDEIGDPYDLSGFVLMGFVDSAQPTYYVDQIEVGEFESDPEPNLQAGPAILVDPTVVNRTISDGVYGLNFADQGFATEIGLPVNRWGGNSTSRYDYTTNATNLASDFFFENHVGAIGLSSDDFINNNMVNGADSLITIGMLDYLPNGNELTGSYRVSVYGAQQEVNMYRPDNGNGIRLDGTRITNNDPFETSDPSDESHANNWVNYLVGQYGNSDEGGVKYYALGNEPMLWNSTHMDVHPDGASYDEVLATGIRYAQAIKSADPSALVLGPVVWGWTAYFYSALDAEPGGAWYLNPLDHIAHDSIPFLQWYLQEMAAYEAENGQRLLDFLDIHFYPQSGVALTGAGDLETQELRLRNTRVLWDPVYVAESWINENVQLIPMMRQWIKDHYPGTKLAITEYNFGGLEHVNGALTQADVLGIFGREGVDLATLWAPPNPSQPGSFAFRMFRNYDGSESASGRFGKVSVLANSDAPDIVSAFAARRVSDEKITLLLINKSRDAMATPISVPNFEDGQVKLFVYGMNDRNNIRQLANVSVLDGQIGVTLEPYSITMLEIAEASSVLLGDINLDGAVNLLDVQPFIELVSTSQFQIEGDLNGDAVVNLLDVDGFIDALSGN